MQDPLRDDAPGIVATDRVVFSEVLHQPLPAFPNHIPGSAGSVDSNGECLDSMAGHR